MEISQTALFLGSIIDLYCLVLILRVWLPLANVDYYNPISQFTLKFTQPVIAPLRKVFPAVKKVETAALVLAFLLCGLKSILFGGLNLSLFLLLGSPKYAR
jgi:YggT family protein